MLGRTSHGDSFAFPGAKLSGGFSRFDYQTRKHGSGPSFRSLKATLPAEVDNVYYRDQIGNISTSDMTWIGDKVELELRPRFPLFGGWKTQFYIGYSVPTTKMLFRENGAPQWMLCSHLDDAQLFSR